MFVRARAHSHRAAQMIEFASDSLFHRFVFSFFLLFFFFFFLNGMRQWLLTCFNFPTFLIQVHYKRPGRLTPLGESLKRERAPDISEDGSGGGYGSGMMGMGGNMGMFGGGFSGMMGAETIWRLCSVEEAAYQCPHDHLRNLGQTLKSRCCWNPWALVRTLRSAPP